LDELNASHSPSEHELASEVSERIRAIISSAEAAASAVRHESEQRAQVKRRLAEDEARRIVEDARRDAEAYLAERIRRISELSDEVVERGEGIVVRLDRAEEVRRQLQGLADALGETAEELARDMGSDFEDRRATPAEIRSEAAAEPAPVTEVEPSEPRAAEADAEPEPVDEPGPAASTTETAAAASAAAEPDSAEPVAAVELLPDTPTEEPASATRAEPDDQLSARLVALQMAVAGGKRAEVETHLRRTFQLPDVDAILDDVFGDGGEDSGARGGWPSTRGDVA
jgi:hypothetical protein